MANYLSKKGSIQGLDISEQMAIQFENRFKNDDRIQFYHQRIDLPFQLEESFSKVFLHAALPDDLLQPVSWPPIVPAHLLTR